jgi:hypothetical protein
MSAPVPFTRARVVRGGVLVPTSGVRQSAQILEAARAVPEMLVLLQFVVLQLAPDVGIPWLKQEARDLLARINRASQ